jgi:hypothetical protein
MTTDTNFTISLPDSDLIFTRSLYLKDEVKISLLMSILSKNDNAVFWAYELYYSGFQHEMFSLLWQIYYDFFATLNPSFEAYFSKKHNEWLINSKKDLRDTIVSALVQDLLFRPFNTDIFFLRFLTNIFQIDINYVEDTEKITHVIDFETNMSHWLDTLDYRSIAQWVLCENKNILDRKDIYKICLELFEQKGVKLTKQKLAKDFSHILETNSKSNNNNNNNNNNRGNYNVILLSRIISLFSRWKQLKKGNSVYITVEPEEIEIYQTLTGLSVKHYQILEQTAIYGIDELKWLSLFKLKRNKYNLPEKYWYHWEYHAAFSPLWLERIKMYKGYQDFQKKTVIFTDELEMQQFYDLYGLEPDEQRKEVQEKCLMGIEKRNNWLKFYEFYKRNGLLDVFPEELEELDMDGLTY